MAQPFNNPGLRVFAVELDGPPRARRGIDRLSEVEEDPPQIRMQLRISRVDLNRALQIAGAGCEVAAGKLDLCGKMPGPRVSGV